VGSAVAIAQAVMEVAMVEAVIVEAVMEAEA